MAEIQRQEVDDQLRASGSMPDELVEIFAEECEDHVGTILDGLDRMCVEITDAEAAADIRRASHTLKGAAAAVGAVAISYLAHRIEEFMDLLKDAGLNPTAAYLELLAQASEGLKKLQQGNFEFEDMGEELHALYGRFETTQESIEQGNGFQAEEVQTIGAELTEFAKQLVDEQPTPELSEEQEAKTQAMIEKIVAQIEKGQTLDPDLQGIYKEEAEEHLRNIYAGLDQLRNDFADREALNSIRRSAHTLKGAAGAVGMETVTRLSHRMEDLLDQIADNDLSLTPSQIHLLLITADKLQDLAAADLDIEDTAFALLDLYNRYDDEMAQTGCMSASEEFLKDVRELDEAEVSVPDPEPAVAAVAEAPKEADQSPTPADASQAAPAAAPAENPEPAKKVLDQSQFLRVPIPRLDSLVALVGEMVVNRSAFHQRLADFAARIEDMQVSIARLRHVANEMETQYSVEALQSNFASSEHRDDLDSLEFDRYTDFHLLARSLSEATSDVGVVGGELKNLHGDFDALLNRQQRFNRDAQASLMHIRMVPVSTVVNRLERTTRTVANKIGKSVELKIEGGQTELDKTVLEEITDPLLHLLRNAIDHGVETPEERRAVGKSEDATIRVSALNQGTQVTLRVSDDGRGIDLDKVRAKAVERGLMGEGDVMTRDELHALIFTPGFSTAPQLTDVSGRGVGMDVVRDAIQRLKGTIKVDSEPGKGATFTIQLPTTLAVTRALLVEANGHRFALPMQSVQQIMRLDPGAVQKVGTKFFVRVNDQSMKLADLAEHMQMRAEDGFDNPKPLLLLRSGDDTVAMTIDEIEGGQDIVVKTLGDHLTAVPGYLGATISGDGTVIPILDPADMCGQQTALPQGRRAMNVTADGGSRRNTAMVIDDSLSVRRVTSNLLRGNGWNVLEAKDGVDALEKLAMAEVPPDVFLCDMEMPRMDGLELIARIRAQDEFALTPIAMVTSRAGEKHRKLASDAGADEHVVKPFKDDQLLALITEMVAGHRETAMA